MTRHDDTTSGRVSVRETGGGREEPETQAADPQPAGPQGGRSSEEWYRHILLKIPIEDPLFIHTRCWKHSCITGYVLLD